MTAYNGREQSIQLTVIRFRTKGFEHPGLEYRDGSAPVAVLTDHASASKRAKAKESQDPTPDREWLTERRAMLDLGYWLPEGGYPAESLERVVERQGLKIIYLPLNPSYLGLLDWQEGIIFVNSGSLNNKNCCRGEANFTIAHELAHWVLHLWAFAEGVDGPREEDEADRYAAAFLMPQPLLEEEPEIVALRREGWPSDELRSAVSALAARYQVTAEAMEDRLKELRRRSPETAQGVA